MSLNASNLSYPIKQRPFINNTVLRMEKGAEELGMVADAVFRDSIYNFNRHDDKTVVRAKVFGTTHDLDKKKEEGLDLDHIFDEVQRQQNRSNKAK